MKKEDLILLFESFLNESGQWNNFEQWLEERGEPTAEDLGFEI